MSRALVKSTEPINEKRRDECVWCVRKSLCSDKEKFLTWKNRFFSLLRPTLSSRRGVDVAAHDERESSAVNCRDSEQTT